MAKSKGKNIIGGFDELNHDSGQIAFHQIIMG
jgi:hypothetical protein